MPSLGAQKLVEDMVGVVSCHVMPYLGAQKLVEDMVVPLARALADDARLLEQVPV